MLVLVMVMLMMKTAMFRGADCGLSAVEIINSSPHLILLCPVRDYDCHEVRLRDDDFLRVQVGVESDDGQDIFFTECGHAIVVNG